ncbi:hypothetical protein B0J17DRAFT_708887 [Rhizoctonia solani]|nr:hypothetical protein B0J17DRAFT_708887 [Rhizoctonia solani]
MNSKDNTSMQPSRGWKTRRNTGVTCPGIHLEPAYVRTEPPDKYRRLLRLQRKKPPRQTRIHLRLRAAPVDFVGVSARQQHVPGTPDLFKLTVHEQSYGVDSAKQLAPWGHMVPRPVTPTRRVGGQVQGTGIIDGARTETTFKDVGAHGHLRSDQFQPILYLHRQAILSGVHRNNKAAANGESR